MGEISWSRHGDQELGASLGAELCIQGWTHCPLDGCFDGGTCLGKNEGAHLRQLWGLVSVLKGEAHPSAFYHGIVYLPSSLTLPLLPLALAQINPNLIYDVCKDEATPRAHLNHPVTAMSPHAAASLLLCNVIKVKSFLRVSKQPQAQHGTVAGGPGIPSVSILLLNSMHACVRTHTPPSSPPSTRKLQGPCSRMPKKHL